MNPETINTRQFSKSFRGYQPKEVESYLNEIADQIEKLVQENESLKKHIVQLQTRLKSALDVEVRVKTILSEMEKTSSTIIEQSRTNASVIATQAEYERRKFIKNAQDEAALIIRDAEKKARIIHEESRDKIKTVQEEISMLHAKRIALIARIKSLLSTEIAFLDSLNRDIKDTAVDSISMPFDIKTKEGLGAEEIQSIIQKLEEQKRSSQ